MTLAVIWRFTQRRGHLLRQAERRDRESSGLDSLPQRVKSCLSRHLREWFFSPDYGVRFAQYLETFLDSPWLVRPLMLDVIRQASIPYHHHSRNQTYTPLQCIERVVAVEVLFDRPIDGRLPIRCMFNVKGIGRWECTISVYLPGRPGSAKRPD